MIGIDLFSGAGGMSLGAKMTGIDVQLVVEADKYAANTYKSNFQTRYPIFNNDIREFNKVKVNAANNQRILFGGPPCQGFSTSNQKTRTLNNESNWLFKEFIRVVSIYRPEWVVFENVKGILETEGGVFVSYILKNLTKLGYKCELEVLNAQNYGVPQKRSRLFIVANLNDTHFIFPSSTVSSSVSVADAINDLPLLENGASSCIMPYRDEAVSDYAKQMRKGMKQSSNHLVTRNSKAILERYEHIPVGGNWENIPESLMGNYTDRTRCHSGIYRRLHPDQPSVVIGNYRKNMLIHPSQNRGLSVREAARLQSFPDDFIFKGTIGFQQQQVGNAVPPLLAKALFEQIQEMCND